MIVHRTCGCANEIDLADAKPIGRIGRLFSGHNGSPIGDAFDSALDCFPAMAIAYFVW